jgi:hypothetical protein
MSRKIFKAFLSVTHATPGGRASILPASLHCPCTAETVSHERSFALTRLSVVLTIRLLGRESCRLRIKPASKRTSERRMLPSR